VGGGAGWGEGSGKSEDYNALALAEVLGLDILPGEGILSSDGFVADAALKSDLDLNVICFVNKNSSNETSSDKTSIEQTSLISLIIELTVLKQLSSLTINSLGINTSKDTLGSEEASNPKKISQYSMHAHYTKLSP